MTGPTLSSTLLDSVLLRAASRKARVNSLPICRGHLTSVLARSMHQAMATEPSSAEYFSKSSDGPVHTRGRTKRKTKISHGVDVRRSAPPPISAELGLPALFGSVTSIGLTELEKRVMALQSVPLNEEPVSPQLTYSDAELKLLYEDLLDVSQPPAATRTAESQDEQDISAIQIAEERLADVSSVPSSLTRTLSVRQNHLEQSFPEVDASLRPYKRLIELLQIALDRLDAVRTSVYGGSKHMQEGVSKEKALVTVLSAAEWAALVRVCIAERDPICAETAITLMKRAWFSPPEESLNTVMQYYAAEGDVTNMQRFIEDVLPGPPTPIQRDLHIKAHLVSSPSHIPPTGALALLHSYETTATPAPIKSYTRLITALFSLSAPQTNSSLTNPNDATSISPSAARAQAWDLFTHMRYVAHPTPDLLLYTLMIRACAASHSSIHSQPERAQDLWTEMTIDKRIIPNEGAYAAVILTLARSGKREFVAEGFRLAREMVDGRGGAGNVGAMRPDRRIFCALLEGAKRIGDLARVRWILAEMVKGSGEQLDSEWQSGLGAGERAERAGIDEEVMMHVFHAYAAYKPPFKRAATKLVDSPESQMEHASEIVRGAQEVRNAGLVEEAGHPQTDPETLSAGSNPLLEDKSDIETDEEISSFSHIPPQTHADVIAEAQVLFARIISDGHSPSLSLDTLPSLHSTTPTSMLHRKFSHVRITPRLLNAYLSIHYAHTSIDASADLWRKVFSACGVEKNVRSYVEALERCAIARRGSGEREAARRWAEEVWKAWEGVEQAGWTKPGARMVERANIAMLRVYTLTDDLDRAMSLLRAFVSRYPPSGTLSGSSSAAATRVKHPMLSTRTVLTGARPLVRITSAPEVADDGVPPLLTFSDIDTLHHRLVSKERVKDIKYLGWVCKAYVGALRRRRELTMKARVDLDDKNTGGMDDDGVE